MSSLPVPVSPWISIVLFIGATSSSVVNTFCIAALQPMMLSKRNRVCSCARSSAFSWRSCRCSMPARSTRDSCDSWNGLIRKSIAPRLIAVDRFVDAAESGDDDGADRREQRERFVEHVHAVRVRQPQVDDQRVVGEPMQSRDGVGAVQRLRDREAVGLETVDDDLPKAWFIFNNEHGRTRTIDNTVCHGTSGERKVFGLRSRFGLRRFSVLLAAHRHVS